MRSQQLMRYPEALDACHGLNLCVMLDCLRALASRAAAGHCGVFAMAGHAILYALAAAAGLQQLHSLGAHRHLHSWLCHWSVCWWLLW